MKSTHWLATASVSAVIFVNLAWFPPNAKTRGHTLAMPPAISLQIVMGVDRQAAVWDGSLKISRGQVTKIQGLEFADGDETDGKSRWKLRTRPQAIGVKKAAKAAAKTSAEPAAENGILVSVADASPDASLYVETAQGNFSFPPAQVPWGGPLAVLRGRL